MQYELKKRVSPKLKSPEWIAYDDKGAAFIIAPFGMRRDMAIAPIAAAINSAPVAEKLHKAARVMLAAFNLPEDGSEDNALEPYFRKPVSTLRAAITEYEEAKKL